ncbi:hypothetical protein J5N97_023249 [Dioscorea zingiberensis]|nr:hypothetical protein J5N97_023249 [Dioscorea zingiberensis]
MFLNYVQAFTGVTILIYSLWILTSWNVQQSHGSHWFVWSAFGVGVSVCLIAFIGYVSAGVINGCCLCFYASLTSILVVLEAAIVGDFILNKHWEKDLPYDHTGELKKLRKFIEANLDICKWFAVAVIAIQTISIILAMILRLMVPSRQLSSSSQGDYVCITKPLLNKQDAPNLASSSLDNERIPSGNWSSRKKDKNRWWTRNQSSDDAVDPKACGSV